MKKQSNLSRLINYAGSYRVLVYLSWILSGVSAVLALLPFYFLWKIVQEILNVMPDFAQATELTYNGWMALITAVASMLIYIAGLMCSHIAAFRVQANLRKEMMIHITTLPLGVMERLGSGKVRKTVNECSASTETYLAHQLPDMVGAYVTPVGLIFMLFAFDWRFGIFCLVPIALSFVVMMTQMTGPGLKEKMNEYQNALGGYVQRSGGIRAGYSSSQDLWADRIFVSPVQGFHRPLQRMGRILHQEYASSDVSSDHVDPRSFRFYPRRRAMAGDGKSEQ